MFQDPLAIATLQAPAIQVLERPRAAGRRLGTAPREEGRGRAHLPFSAVALVYLMLIFGLPALLVAILVAATTSGGWWLLAPALVISPFVYGVGFVVVAGLLSMPHQHAVRPGRFPRDLADPTYRARRLYGLCWTSVYYATPLYFLALSLPWFKRLTFRLFGYRGQMDFTVYPDTWIRDLPLLEFGKGAYVSNKATLGTNVAQSNGSLLVDRVRVGAGALVGHLSMLSTGTVLEDGAEVGVGCAVGSKVRLGKDSFLGACCAVGHLVEFGEAANVGYMSSIGIAARIGPGVRLPQVSLVPNRARVDDQSAADALRSSASSPVPRLTERLATITPNPEAPRPAEGNGHPKKGAGRLGWNRFE
jgi:carbonic anhydrase/acetyltransferase-like protein (isoleucine patch superfamily)